MVNRTAINKFNVELNAINKFNVKLKSLFKGKKLQEIFQDNSICQEVFKVVPGITKKFHVFQEPCNLPPSV